MQDYVWVDVVNLVDYTSMGMAPCLLAHCTCAYEYYVPGLPYTTQRFTINGQLVASHMWRTLRQWLHHYHIHPCCPYGSLPLNYRISITYGANYNNGSNKKQNIS